MNKKKDFILEYIEYEYEYSNGIQKNHVINNDSILTPGQYGEDEDFLIGSEKGLKNLINACKIALDKGEYVDQNLDQFVGIKLVKSSYYKEENETVIIWLIDKFVIPAVIVVFLASVAVGFVTIVKWIF